MLLGGISKTIDIFQSGRIYPIIDLGFIIDGTISGMDFEKRYTESSKTLEAVFNYPKTALLSSNYTYLNYGRIERTPNDKERARLKREGAEHVETVMGFPRYWDGDYWNFKIDEFIANNKFHLTTG